MQKSWLQEFFEFVRTLEPLWALATLVSAIVAYRLPQIIREILTGTREHTRVTAEIRAKQQRVERDLAAKAAKIAAKKEKDVVRKKVETS